MGRLRATFILPLKQEVFSGVALVNSETYFDKEAYILSFNTMEKALKTNHQTALQQEPLMLNDLFSIGSG